MLSKMWPSATAIGAKCQKAAEAVESGNDLM